MNPPIREARLRPEFAHLYPGLQPDVWYAAAALAEHLLTRARLLHDAELRHGARALDDAHFEFRGGSPPGRQRSGVRERLGDRAAPEADLPADPTPDSPNA